MKTKNQETKIVNVQMITWLKPFVVPLSAAAGVLLGASLAFILPSEWFIIDEIESSKTGSSPLPVKVKGNYQDHTHSYERNKDYWACPMFCTRMDTPGECPVCGMTLEKFVDTGMLIPLGKAERLALGIETEKLKKRYLAREVRTVGIFEPDETQEKVVAAWIDGRIEKLYADFTGVPIKKGQHLFDLYSPSLYSAQKELLIARDAVKRSDGSASTNLLQLAREKLELLGLSKEQVTHIETLDEPQLTLTISAPSTGIVLKKLVHQGMYVKQGQPIYHIANLNPLWLMVDIHERDASWISLGQMVDVDIEGLPGVSIQGQIGFIGPELNPKTRTIQVRVEVENSKGLIRPGMFATATIFAELTKEATLAPVELEGNFACPMHPLERSIKANQKCLICGMRQVKIPSDQNKKKSKVLAVPREAVLTTGRRHIVYVESRNEHTGQRMYQGFQVKLGPLASEWHVMGNGVRHKTGEYYPVTDGLTFDMSVVTNGSFLVDSQMELTGKPSLLRPEGGSKADPHAGHKK